MTDEQLRAMARRVLGLVAQHYTPQSVRHGKRIYLLPETMPDADEMEAAAVAIMREEMAKAKSRAQLSMEWIPSEEELARIRSITPDDMALPFDLHDPTQNFVATT